MATPEARPNKRTIWLFFILLTLALLIPPACAYAATPSGNWVDNVGSVTSLSGGDGVYSDLEIGTPEELAFAMTMINKGMDSSGLLPGPRGNEGWHYKSANFKLTADIDLSAHYWSPIGIGPDVAHSFDGIFNGNGHVITGVNLRTDQIPSTYSGYTSLGFFGSFGSYGRVKNLGLVDVSIAGLNTPTISLQNVGGLIGIIQGRADTITNVDTCFVSGFVQGAQAPYVGGLVGNNGTGYLANSLVNARVSNSYLGDSNAGGIVGLNNGGSIKSCSSLGFTEITSTAGGDAVGGLAGASLVYTYGPTTFTGTIQNSFSSNEIRVNGPSYAGGCIGYSGAGTVVGTDLSFNNDQEQYVNGKLRDANNRLAIGAGQGETNPKKCTSAQMTAPSTALATMNLSPSDWSTFSPTTDVRYYPIPTKLVTGMSSVFVDIVKRLSSEKIPSGPTPPPSGDIPPVSGGTYFYFGSYPQTEITSTAELAKLTAGVDYIAYQGKYYRIEPLLWVSLVTPNDPEHVTLITKSAIDRMQYNTAHISNSGLWVSSTLRDWICGTSQTNGKPDFLNEAYFEPALYNAIVPQQADSGTIPANTSVFDPSVVVADRTTLSRAQVLNTTQYPMPSDAGGFYESDYAKAVDAAATGQPSKKEGTQVWTRTIADPTSSMDTLTVFTSAQGAWIYDTLASTDSAGVRPSVTINLKRVAFKKGADGKTDGDGTASKPYTLEALYTPHGGYSTASSKCASCHAGSTTFNGETKLSYHAVPSDGTNRHLISSNWNDPCVYCHVDTTTKKATITGLYGGYASNYQINTDEGHNFNAETAVSYASKGQDGVNAQYGASCTDCHAVHGAGTTGNIYLDQMLLKAPDSSFDTAGATLFQQTMKRNGWSTEDGEVAVSAWCVGCHSAPHSGDIADGAKDVIDTHLAANESFTCVTCHGASYGTSAWPHYIAGVDKFLLSADSAESTATGAASALQDGVCLRCHRANDTSDISTP